MGIVVQLERHLRLSRKKIVGRNRPTANRLELGGQLPRGASEAAPDAANGGAVGLDLGRDSIIVQAGNGHPRAELHRPESASGARACQAPCAPQSMDVEPSCAQNAQMSKKARFQYSTYLRAWRMHRGMKLDDAAHSFGMTGQNLGKVERGLVPYDQELLEAAAHLYNCKPDHLLNRDPKAPSELWDTLANVSEAEAQFLVGMLGLLRAFAESMKDRAA